MKTFTFYTDSVEVKQDGEDYFVEGYISTSDLDRVGDIVTKTALQDLVSQIKSKSIKLDVEHESWTQSPNIIPIGRIVDAELDANGVKVKAILNKHVSRFEEVLNSVKSGFLDAFSIAYKAVDFVNQTVGGKIVRMLNKVELLNVALTGNPANPNCKIASVMMKSLEAETMTEEQPVVPVVDVKALQEEMASFKSLLEATKTETIAAFAEAKSAREVDAKIVAELKAKIEAAEAALAAPQIKGLLQAKPVEDAPVTNVLQMIR